MTVARFGRVNRRNPSFEGVAPHCTLMPRHCYCQTDEGVRRCDVGRKGSDDTTRIIEAKYKGDIYLNKPFFKVVDPKSSEFLEFKKKVTSEFYQTSFDKKLRKFDGGVNE